MENLHSMTSIIDAIKAGDASEAKTMFQTILFKKIADLMDHKKEEVAKGLGKALTRQQINLAQDD